MDWTPIAPAASGLLRFRCKACGKDFSITSGTLFAAHKAPLRAYLAAIAVFMNEVKGKNALALSRDLGMSHKACWVLLHKTREAMAAEFKGRRVGGEGKTAEVDGAYFGGYVKPANLKGRIDRRFLENQTGKRQSVIIVRERNGRSIPAVFRSEKGCAVMDQARIEPGTLLIPTKRPAQTTCIQIRNEADQSSRGLLSGRRLHEPSRKLFLAHPSRGDGPSSPH